MRFSVVIPTHNRLHLLRDALETIRRQSYSNWEVVVFDNASRDPIRDHVSSLRDARVKYARSDAFLPVTSSWNEAISRATGDYVVLLGDDDGLVPDYFDRLKATIEQFDSPDVVYNNIYQFWHPGVAPWEPSGYVIDVRHGFFFANRKEPFLLGHEDAFRAARGSVRLRINFSFNSQAILYNKVFLQRLASDGLIYRSPFPDYYIANVALVRSRRTVVIPDPLAVAGVSKASFGFTIYNNKDDEGAALLNTQLENDPVYRELRGRLLAGNSYNTNFVVAMEYVARALPELHSRVDFARYRRAQIFSALKLEAPSDTWSQIRPQLSMRERIWAFYAFRMFRAGDDGYLRRKILRRLEDSVSMLGSDPMARHCGKCGFSRVTEVYDALASGVLS